MDLLMLAWRDPVRIIPMSRYFADPGSHGADDFDPTDGWGEVPEADRPVWARYMLDHFPWFPGITIMSLVGDGMAGRRTAFQQWKDAAAELHSLGFTPIQYYLLAELLKDALKRGELNASAHGHLFKKWFEGHFSILQLNAEAWKPWLDQLAEAESPRRALQHMLRGPRLPPMGGMTVEGQPHRS